MLRIIGLVLILVGTAAACLGGIAWTAPEERVVAEAPQPAMEEREVAFVLPGDTVGVVNTRSAETTSNVFRPAASARTGGGEIPIAHEAPREAQFGVPFDVSLAIDASGAPSARGGLRGGGEVVEATVVLSGEVQARLSGGTAFEVEALSPLEQTLSRSVANAWRWSVTPLASGQHTLIIDVFQKTETGALEPVSSYRDTVMVEVSTLRQAITLAQTANPLFMVLGGIGSVLGGAVTALRFFSGAAGRG
ncbi:MAG: hypothetical protein AAGH87_09000 [Pseudomonadota bacterium]